MHYTLIVGILVGILIGFAAIQYATAVKSHRFLIRLLPLALPVLVLIFCIVISALDGTSPSIVAENRTFAFFLAVPAASALVGCCMGLILYRLTKESKLPSTEE